MKPCSFATSLALVLLVLAGPARADLFTVLNLADGGVGSLRAAVEAANANPGADVIDFAPGLTGAIGLTSGQLDVTDDLIVEGPGASVLAVSGSDVSRVFRIGSGVTADIDDLTITHGRANNGGGTPAAT